MHADVFIERRSHSGNCIMFKTLASALLIAGIATSATAQGIQPVTEAPELDVTVGTIEEEVLIYGGIAVAAATIFILASDESDGSQ